MNIEWKDDAVCYAKGRQWLSHTNTHLHDGGCHIISIQEALESTDFQLNIPREGDYLRKDELDSEGKYNGAVQVFGLFGIVDPSENGYLSTYDVTIIDNDKLVDQGYYTHHHNLCKRELTYNQLMTIGNIKRLLDEKESVKVNNTICGKPKEDFVKAIERVNELESEGKVTNPNKNIKRNKSKQAYDILQSLDYEYDLVEQRWYRKDWV